MSLERSKLLSDRVLKGANESAAGRAWVAGLPQVIADLARRWSLGLDEPLQHDGFTAAVIPATTAAGHQAVLKLGLPHMEARDEAAGLAFWDGDPTVRLLAYDEASGALLLERCVPGRPLGERPAEERDATLAGLIRRLWREPRAGHGFRPLAQMLSHWRDGILAAEERWPDATLVREGLAALEELMRPRAGDVLLGTDVHAGNVLAADRSPWLVIDVKPFVGDRAYDATQHLFNERERLASDPVRLVRRWASLLDLSQERVRAWAFARFAAERRDSDAEWRSAQDIARRLAS